jgi:hypothetical protein
MKSSAIRPLVLVVCALVPRVTGAEPSGRELLERQEEARKLPSFQAKASLSTSKAGEPAKAPKRFRWWRKLGDDRTRFVTLIRFDEPATIRGEAVLIREDKRQNNVLLYLPHFKKVRRVEGQSQSSNFFGSVFSYSDVAVPHADDSTAKVLREESCPGEQRKCWVVEVSPATAAIKDRTGYSRSVQWIHQDTWVTVAGDFYDQKNKLWKRLTATEVKEVDPKAHKWLPHRIRLEDVQKNRTTDLRLTDVKVNVRLDDTLFTDQNLANE